SKAPFNNNEIVSILRRFHEFFQLPRFAISRGVDCNKVSTIRRLFARNDDPVSVISTIASTSSWALTSVAPQENSTSALTLFFRKYFRVRLTTSVAIRFPRKSLTLRIGESSGTASTQRAGCRLTLLNTNSPTS